jgi:transposase, IS30 family
MKQRRRIYYSAAQRSEIWDRWQAGEPMSSIGRRFDRESSSVFSVIWPSGGIRPPARRRAGKALSLTEREEISRRAQQAMFVALDCPPIGTICINHQP